MLIVCISGMWGTGEGVLDVFVAFVLSADFSMTFQTVEAML